MSEGQELLLIDRAIARIKKGLSYDLVSRR